MKGKLRTLVAMVMTAMMLTSCGANAGSGNTANSGSGSQASGSATVSADPITMKLGLSFADSHLITQELYAMSDAVKERTNGGINIEIYADSLLGKETEGNTLGEYCDMVYSRTNKIAESVEKANLLYCLGDKGENVIAKGSYHAEIIDLLSNNLAVVESPSSKGTGNEVDIEQILKWNPDVILFAPGSVYATVGEDPAWQGVNAIKNGTYYEVPIGPYNWMGFPPSVQRMLGMMWMAKLLYPEAADYDLYTEVAEYFRLFYHTTLSEDAYNALAANSIGTVEVKAAA